MDDDEASTIYSEKDNDKESYYDSLRNHKTVPVIRVGELSTTRAEIHPDGAFSSSGVWTNSGSGGSDRDLVNTTVHEDTTPRVLIRPKSSLSMGVVADSESNDESVEPTKETLA